MASVSTKPEPEKASSPAASPIPEASGGTDAKQDTDSGKTATDSPATSTEANRVPAPPAVDAQQQISSLQAEFGSLSAKNTLGLVTFENNLNRARKFIAEDNASLREQADALRGALQEKMKQNQAHQESLRQQSEKLVVELEKALADGQSAIALSTWDKIQGAINNTHGELKKALQTTVLPFKTPIKELRDWKIFAATEKKKELVQQMEKLCGAELKAGELSKQISRLHRDWKALGRSNQNEELWQQFKQLSDKANEPCKEFFKLRKQQMAANYQARKTLCESLEVQLDAAKTEPLKLAALNKLLKDAEQTWQQHAPVDQGKIKQLQKKYYGLINEFRKLRRNLVKHSAQAKLAIIDKANGLLSLEDNRQAMAEAKKLQSEWKTIGPGSFKDDKQYWSKFRSICDQIFAVREKQQAERKVKAENVRSQLQQSLAALEQLLSLENAELRDRKKDYKQLQQTFAANLENLPARQRNQMRDQFNGIKRKLDALFNALPDKKSQAALDNTQSCSTYLEKIEAQLFANGSDDSIAKLQQSFDAEQWQSLITLVQEEDAQQLQQRADCLSALRNTNQLQAAASEAKEQFRELCLQAEIRAAVDSPAEEQDKRMALQLSQLKQGFGKSQQQGDGNPQFVTRCRLKALCIGPLDEAERSEFRARLEKSLQRLF